MHTTSNSFGLMATAFFTAENPREHTEPADENAEYLPRLIRECERLGLALHLTDDPTHDLPEIKVINGQRNLIARSDELGIALDELRHGHSAEQASLDQLTAAVDHAMRQTLPGQYTPQLAAQIAAGMIGRLAATEEPLTPAQSTPVLDEGIGARITAPVETRLRDIDDQHTVGENAETPFLAAQMVVSDYRSQAYGRRTEVWLHYGCTTGSLTPAKAREVLAAMRGFVDRFESVVTLAEETAAGDFDGDPEIARLDTEAERRRVKARTAELLAAKA